MSDAASTLVTCNGATLPSRRAAATAAPLVLDYRQTAGNKINVKLLLPDFVRQTHHLPDRVLDLLEIAAYIFAADRSSSRGPKDALEYHRWHRSFHFVIRVRDHRFWQRKDVQQKLNGVLCQMTGDDSYRLTFQAGHRTPATGLFDQKEFLPPPGEGGTQIMLFSGGLDSLAGVFDQLTSSSGQVCLVSHQSGQPSTVRTQQRLYEALRRGHSGRLVFYKFQCGLTGRRAEEESQRTRSFLYGSIAFALAHVRGRARFYFYENGVTAISLPRRQDLINARASRTVHPKTIRMLADFLGEVQGDSVSIETPFLWKTKADVFGLLATGLGRELITSTVSCSKTFQNLGSATHCGGCSQCIDRRFAAYAAGLEDVDEGGIYARDFVCTSVTERDVKTTLVDYVRQARNFSGWNLDHFYAQNLAELADLVDYLPGNLGEGQSVERVWELLRRHGEQVQTAMRRMRERHDDPFRPVPPDSFLGMIGSREYLDCPVRTVSANGAEAALNTMAMEPVDFIILTALAEEREAVLGKLAGVVRVPPSEDDVRAYHVCDVPTTLPGGADCRYRVVVCSCLNMGRVEAATAAVDAVRRWRPRYVLLVGIAGGLEQAGVKLGDILVAEQVADFETQKITKKGAEPRYSVHKADPRLLEAAKHYTAADWQRLIAVERPTAGEPSRLFGPVATGDKVIADRKALATYLQDWPKLIGVEMEAGGLAAACFQAADAPGFFMIRSVSDFADAKKKRAEVEGWRRYACDVAAAYAVGFLKSGPVPPAPARGGKQPPSSLPGAR